MKNKSIFFFSTICALAFQSCTKNDLGITAEQSLSAEVALSNKATAQSTLLGVYSTAQSLDAFGAGPQILGDFQADNVDFVGSFPTLQDIKLYSIISTNATTAGWWQVHYQVISRANTIINRVAGIADPTFTTAEKNAMIAEAKFLRALTYFQLANIYSHPFQISNGTNLCVPLITTEFTGAIDKPKRATLNEVHAQIKKDLDEAIAAPLPASYTAAADTRGRATLGAARALLSRLHLYRGEWTLSADAANLVIANTAVYSIITSSYNYGRNTTEDVFSLQMTATDNSRTGSGGWASYHRPAALGGRGDCPFSPELVTAFQAEAGDLRFALSAMGVAADGISKRFTLKFPDAVNNTDNSPLIRLPEIILNRAEALAQRDGLNQTSVDLMNTLRVRAGLTARTLVSFANKQALIDAILNERRKELAFEGHRRMDLLRNGRALATGAFAAASAPGADKTIMPIPQRERDNNPNLDQNKGY